MNWLSRFFLLLCGHALGDYVFQVPFKSPYRSQIEYPDHVYGPWWWGMAAHSLINGGIVYLITGNLVWGVLETGIHFTLDTLKCYREISTHVDQLGHLLCKVIWVW